ncbi:MAG: acetate--CoA ligase family protein [Desulfovibrio sp.]
MHSINQIHALFRPESILIAHATEDGTDIGHNIIRSLQRAGYTGKITPVNDETATIADIKSVSSIQNAPDFVDLAIICNCSIPVTKLLSDLKQKSVKAVLLMDSLHTHQDEPITIERLRRLGDVYNMLILGPDCLGFAAPHAKASTIPSAVPPAKGNIAFFSQSKTLCASVLDQAIQESVGFSLLTHLPHSGIINEIDILRYLGNDDETSVIIGSIDRIENGREFIETVQNITYTKPVIMLKAGTTVDYRHSSGLQAGPPPGAVMAYRAAFKQSGAIPVEDMETLFSLGRAFSTQPLPKGPATWIISDKEAICSIGASCVEQSDLFLAKPDTETLQMLKDITSGTNPLLMQDKAQDTALNTLKAAAKCSHVQSIIFHVSETITGDKDTTLQKLHDLSGEFDIPVMLVCDTRLRSAAAKELPSFHTMQDAVFALDKMYQYACWKEQPYPVEISFRRDTSKARTIIANAIKLSATELPSAKARDVARAYELPVPETCLARTSDQAAKAAKRLGYPVALKVESPQIEHKSVINGVRLNLQTPMEVRKAFKEVTNTALRLRRDDAYISGCTIQPMAPEENTEVTIRLRRDPQFGAMVIFGMSPYHIDILGDCACRLAPLTTRDAAEAVREIQSFDQLKAHGNKAPSLGAIEDILLAVSRMGEELPYLQEVEISPLLVHSEGAFVADVRMSIGRY